MKQRREIQFERVERPAESWRSEAFPAVYAAFLATAEDGDAIKFSVANLTKTDIQKLRASLSLLARKRLAAALRSVYNGQEETLIVWCERRQKPVLGA